MRRTAGFLYLLVSLAALLFCWIGPYPLNDLRGGDIPYLLLVMLHAGWGVFLIASGGRYGRRRTFIWIVRVPEILFSCTLLLFLFSYIYALNANMDYVQRFIATGGNLRLARDTSEERIIAWLRHGPLLLGGAGAFIGFRLAYRRRFRELWMGPSAVRTWAFPLVLLSVILAALSFPSFVHLDGLGFLAFVALVPLFVVLRQVSYGWGVFYGVCFGVFFNLILNYWLGPYSLVSLLMTVVLFLVLYVLFMAPALWIFHSVRRGRFLVFPLAWVVFDYLRSVGFLGYPWGFFGLTQYRFLPLIQTAAVTGVWGVSFVVLLVNAGLASAVCSHMALFRRWGETEEPRRCSLGPMYLAVGVLVGCMLLGGLRLAVETYRNPCRQAETVRIALVQQNSDPRKHDYGRTFGALKRLTDRAVREEPDLIAWSETAFVPNIRRWSREDPERYALAALVRDFLAYQRSLNTWLVTGNDDYVFRMDEEGRRVRADYNAAVLFSSQGRRVDTYHKVRLVPFTEHFPYRETMPRVYRLLQEFDVTFWEPGAERRVLEHPRFCFATPICFEDAFPNDVRRFVLAGAEVILNLSNDYWSLTKVEAKQHAIASLFRAVENRRPLLRSTASGLTVFIDPAGRIIRSIPYYREAQMVVDVELPGRGITAYTRFGDWFPWAALVGVGVLLSLSLTVYRRM